MVEFDYFGIILGEASTSFNKLDVPSITPQPVEVGGWSCQGKAVGGTVVDA